MTGFATLLYKELLRFWKVSFQTMAAPVLTALLYLLIFAHALEGRVNVYQDVRYTAFLVPGLVMMSVLQNAFANSSSSLIQSKITGNLVFVLLAPVSYVEFFWAYVLASMARAMAVGLGVLAAAAWFVQLRFDAPLWALAFALLGSALLGTLGLVAGIRAERFDQLAGFQNFVILPLTFLSGRVLLDPLPAGVLADDVARQSLLLHDRRLSLRVLRCLRRLARGEPRCRRVKLRAGRGGHALDAQARLQTAGIGQW